MTGAPTPTSDLDALRKRLDELLEPRVLSVHFSDGPGVMAAHYRAMLDDGTAVFLKRATSEFSQDVLRDEVLAYETIGRQPFMASMLAADDDLLIIEDLAHAYWPPPWRDRDVRPLEQVLDDIQATTPPAALRELSLGPWSGSWTRIADDRQPLLSLHLCTDQWLTHAIDTLIALDGCSLSGGSLVHGDLRSDNMCIVDDRVVAVDWAAAAKGRSDYDRTSFAIPFAVETKARPEVISPNADPALVTMLTAVLACHAPNPAVPHAIRQQLTAQLEVALPWCARLLSLPSP